MPLLMSLLMPMPTRQPLQLAENPQHQVIIRGDAVAGLAQGNGPPANRLDGADHLGKESGTSPITRLLSGGISQRFDRCGR